MDSIFYEEDKMLETIETIEIDLEVYESDLLNEERASFAAVP